MKQIQFNDKTVYVYETPREFANNPTYKPFGEIPEEYWEFDVSITDGKSTGFADVDNKAIHLFFENDCPMEDLINTVAHELGHIQPRMRKNINEEKRADIYGALAQEAYEISKLIL